MCTSCGWETALRNLAILRNFRLAKMARWIEEKRHIVPREWKAIRTTAINRNMLHRIEIPAEVVRDVFEIDAE